MISISFFDEKVDKQFLKIFVNLIFLSFFNILFLYVFKKSFGIYYLLFWLSISIILGISKSDDNVIKSLVIGMIIYLPLVLYLRAQGFSKFIDSLILLTFGIFSIAFVDNITNMITI